MNFIANMGMNQKIGLCDIISSLKNLHWLWLYRVSHEERSFWEVIVLVILSKNVFTWTYIPFRTVSEIGLFECTTAKLLIWKRYYVYILLLIPVFIVQVTELVWFIINVQKCHCQHQCTLQLVWRHGVWFLLIKNFAVVHSNSSISETVRNRTHVHINIFTKNDRYYDLPEYWPFLLGHPVYDKQNNSFGSLLNRQATMICYFTKLPPSQRL